MQRLQAGPVGVRRRRVRREEETMHPPLEMESQTEKTTFGCPPSSPHVSLDAH